MNPLPLRITFLPTVFQPPPGAPPAEEAACLILFVALFEHMIRHPRVAVTDPDDFMITDPDNRLVNALHPNVKNVKMYEFIENRRDEILWFEIAFDPANPSVRLKAERWGDRVDEFVASGGGALSDLIANALHQWLAARGLADSPKPIEPFTAQDFAGVAGMAANFLVTARQNPDAAQNMMQLPPRLAVAYTRFVGITLGIGVEQTILRLEPDNVWALRDDHLARWHDKGASRDEIRRVIQMAPNWGKPRGVMWGEGVTDDETFYHAAVEAALIPANSFALDAYGNALARAGRYEEGFRHADRGARLTPAFLGLHTHALDMLADNGRYPLEYHEATRRLALVDDFVKEGRFNGAEPDMCLLRLQLANAFYNVGRSEEAIQLRMRALDAVFNRDQWPKMRELLKKWQTDPDEISLAYAREGYYRADPGRCVDGCAHAEVDTGVQLRMYVESLIATGKTDLALLAYAHYSRERQGRSPAGCLAGARAFFANGQLGLGVELLLSVELRSAQSVNESEVNRLLRLGSAFPAEQWEQQVSQRLSVGAWRLARLVARDAADFVPGLENSSVLAQALQVAAPVAFDPSWLSPLHDRLAKSGLETIDQLFATHAAPTLEHADALSGEWLEKISPDDGSDASWRVACDQGLYLLAQSLVRYLAGTTQPPSVLCGGYRAVATDALLFLRSMGASYDDATLHAFFAALERVSGADEWIFDTWLLRVERALGIDTGRGGHVSALLDGLPKVSSMFRGDEQVSTEWRLCLDSKKDPAAAARALPQFERSFRAIGGSVASVWSDAVSTAGSLQPQQALDVHWTCVAANPGNAGPAVNAARVLFGFGRADLAFDVLCSRLGRGGKQWREKQVASFKPAWEAARFDVPIDFVQAQSKGFAALQAGQFAEALRCYRWCDALDSGNAAALRNLGFLYCQLGMPFEAVAHFAEVDAKQGPFQAATTFHQAQKMREAVLAYRYATLGSSDPQAFGYFAQAAFTLEDDENAALAYGKLYALTRGAGLDLAALNAYAGVLDNVGDAKACEAMGRRLIELAKGDRTYTSCGLHHVACGLLGQGRGAEAVQPAQQALQMNPLPENTAVFTETLQRAQRNEPRPVKPLASHSDDAKAFEALARGEFDAVKALAQNARTWKLMHAVLRGYEFRSEADNGVPVTQGAKDAARWVLQSTPGALDPDAILARTHALAIREAAAFAADPPPMMGRRMPREKFEQMFAPMAPSAGVPGATPAAAGGGGDADPVVFPGTKLAKLSDYVGLMKAMQGGNPMAALAKYGLDMQSYGPLAMQWGQKLGADPGLAQKFQQMMSR